MKIFFKADRKKMNPLQLDDFETKIGTMPVKLNSFSILILILVSCSFMLFSVIGILNLNLFSDMAVLIDEKGDSWKTQIAIDKELSLKRIDLVEAEIRLIKKDIEGEISNTKDARDNLNRALSGMLKDVGGFKQDILNMGGIGGPPPIKK